MRAGNTKESSHIYQIQYFQPVGQIHVSRQVQRNYETSNQKVLSPIIFCTPTTFSNISISKHMGMFKFYFSYCAFYMRAQ